ncbi:DEAD/DEAH box helicase domain protein [Emticicia oligotrophica DSM 17448]|uniref:DEAD/DEAH box helicase domain protein n=1 Tax=Emticicia oligotrophica (strain DSM 17448 / CIP 109782 / MTCC 6937 / GPTSA100-15) TaxID=929562 RepID=A0ABM5N2C4_EMTOG|nr:DEAD/DEAH box helicase [Emticicia oligotrophica]AFK03563.1 DEAD/DEAH box helicase domain protein [Emticicia oligotrophica DSM 17448]
MTFNELNLNKQLINALDDLGYTTPTTIQQKVFSVVMSGKDVCGIAQTGTGKTFAYLLPSLRQYQFSKEKMPQVLIIVPTRELVVQVVESIQKITTYMSVITVGVYGGVNIKPQILDIQNGVDILVGTPGRLIDLLSSGFIKTKSLKKLIIDEVDEMLNLGFRPQLKNILDLLPARRQNLLFSATITEEVEQIIETYFNEPMRVEAAPAGSPLENISQTLYHVPNFNTKVNLLELLLMDDDSMSKVLIFAATKELADQLYNRIERKYGEKVGIIHSNKAQNTRFNTVKAFQEGSCKMLIATDIIARGIDIAEVSHVINFDIPEVPENYIHRIGRTGRVDKKGIAITFMTPKEIEQIDAIEEMMNYEIPVAELPENLTISDVLTEAEMPQVKMKNVLVKAPKREDVGPAFHEKLAKNKKVNVRRDIKAEKWAKYGRPIKKSGNKPKRGDR